MMYVGACTHTHTHTHTHNYSTSLKAKESVVGLPLPNSLHQRAAAEWSSSFLLLFGFPVAAVAAIKESHIAFIVEVAFNP